MAKDTLEQFIISNKEAFDDREPSDKVWNNISRKMSGSSGYSYIWKAAAIIFFCSTVLLLLKDLKPSASSSELAELEEYYFTQIDYKRSLMNNLPSSSVDIGSVDQELQKLDAMYLVLKEEWKRKPSKQVLEALTLNLLVRLDLLNRQLEATEGSGPANDDVNI